MASGIYFRAYRDGAWDNVEFEYLTHDEREKYMAGRSTEWLKALAHQLALALDSVT